MDEGRYREALQAVAGWVAEMMRSDYEEEEALETLLLVLKSGALGAVYDQVRGYEAEIEAVIKNRLGETN